MVTDYFNRNFEIISVNTDPLLEEVLRLRYQVYCIENTLADPDIHTDCKEHDPYDSHSVHRLIRHKVTGVFVASVRLILPNPDDQVQGFPIEAYCGKSFYPDAIPSKQIPRESFAEVSRFLVSKKRLGLIKGTSVRNMKEFDPDTINHKRDGLYWYLLLFGLFSAVVRMTIQHNISYWYVGVEPAFHRLLKKFGIDFPSIGPLFEYHGKRIPCLGSTESILSGIHKYRPDVWRFITQDGKLTRPNQQDGLNRNRTYCH